MTLSWSLVETSAALQTAERRGIERLCEGDGFGKQVVPLSEGDDPADLAKEIELLAACDHPNVVRYLVSRTILVAC